MPEKNYGGAAFPVADTDSEGRSALQEGMSLRDYFAAKAIQSIVLLGVTKNDPNKAIDMINCAADIWAKDAYFIADAMIKARGE